MGKGQTTDYFNPMQPEYKPRYQAFIDGVLFEIRYIRKGKYRTQYYIDNRWVSPTQWAAAQRAVNERIRDRIQPVVKMKVKLK